MEADICVVGAGAAGLALALELRGSALRVCVLEAGGERPDRATQSLLQGEAPFYGETGLEETRLSCLGGTTRVWSGWCRPLDPAVFEPRSGVDEDGWPFPREHLDPFYERAQAVCGLGPFDYDVPRWRSGVGAPLPLDPELVETRLFQMSPPTRFGRAYHETLRRARDLRLLLRAPCIELVTEGGAPRVAAARCATLGGNTFAVRARFFVLAAGGIENARLLLLSDRDRPGGLGNAHGLVGRYFMEHPYVTAGRLQLKPSSPPLRFYHWHRVSRDDGRVRVRGAFAVPRARVRAERLTNAVLFPLPPWESAPTLDSPGGRALRAIATMLRRGWFPGDGWSHAREALGDPVGTLGALYQRLVRPRIGLPDASAGPVRIRAFCEPVPRRSSRVELTGSRDRLGRRRVRVAWEPSELEIRSLERGFELLARAVREAGLGRMEWSLDSGDVRIEGGRHHMGTTRMHADPRRGVVDPGGRVHGVDNLFVAGSSVFPTAGVANPTLTIVALAIRLADHLKRLGGRTGASARGSAGAAS